MTEREEDRRGPLAGLRVLELGEMVAAPYCAKLLGDLGADVVKVEDPKGGDPARLRGSLDIGGPRKPDLERSGSFLYLNTSKRSLRLDLASEEDRETFTALALRADVLIEDRAPGVLEALGLDYEVLSRNHPGLIVCSLTPFGQSGPNAQHRSEHLNLYHAGGHVSPFATVGSEDRAPSRAGGYLGEYDAGLTAALGALAAVYGRGRTGRGQHIDCSKQEAMMCLERVTIGRFANEPDPFSGSGGPFGLSRAKDGWVMLTTLEEHQWEGLVRAMGKPTWAQADWCKTPEGRMQHMEEIRASLGSQPAPAPRTALQAESARPLEGVRIADFTWAWAGPQGSLLLGMLGAEVIKIESRARLDHTRVHSLTAGSLRGGIDDSPVFNDLNLGKRSVTLNLRTEGGRDLVKQLVAQCDVVVQNMRPGVLDRMGLGYEDLSAVRPDIIMLSSSAVGATGPEGNYAGYAPTFACLSGIASISGHPDEPPIALSGSVDLRVGTTSAFAVLAALHHRRHTGEGQNIDLSSSEVMSAMMGHAFLDYQLCGRVPARMGNRDEMMAPHGCYRCRGKGEWGAWVTIAIARDDEWTTLRGILEDAELDGSDFATAAARKQHEDRLDDRIERWTRVRSVDEVVALLQAAGIAAARVQSGESLSRDPHVEAREVFASVEHPLLGELRVVRPPWRMEGAEVSQPAPLLGQHNDYVLGEILGLDPDEIAELIEAEIVY